VKAGLKMLCFLFSAFSIPVLGFPFSPSHHPPSSFLPKWWAAVVAGVDDGAPGCGGRFFMAMWVFSIFAYYKCVCWCEYRKNERPNERTNGNQS